MKQTTTLWRQRRVRKIANVSPSVLCCAQSCFVPRFAQISSYQAEISYESTWLFFIGRISSLPVHSLFSPLGMAVPQREARDPTVAKLSPHHPRNSWQMYASALPSVFTIHSVQC